MRTSPTIAPVSRLISQRVWILVLLAFAGCRGETALEGLRQAMYDQPRYEPMEASTFFGDGLASRSPVKGTVARGQMRADGHLYTGMGPDGKPAKTFPFPISQPLLQRGRQRYDIYCSPCHDYAGTGKGMAVQRGFKQPTSYHVDRLREAPPGYFFDVITRGFGAMYSYAARVSPEDRWAITAYIRALQLSQNGRMEDVPKEEREPLEAEKADSY